MHHLGRFHAIINDNFGVRREFRCEKPCEKIRRSETMKNLLIPGRLKKGDKVASLSLSWGGAGDEGLLWRYHLGVERLRDVFGLEVVAMPHALKGSAYVAAHPEKRAEDLNRAFADSSIKAVFSNIGGDDSIRMLPYINFEILARNPKIFLGYSDSTITHFMLLKAGVRSYYGPSILAEFAENGEIFPYTRRSVEKALFTSEEIGRIDLPEEWTSEYLPWTMENRTVRKKMNPCEPAICLRGSGMVRGPLIGGCIEVMEFMKETILWDRELFDGAVIFFETSEDMPTPTSLTYFLRNYGIQGILHKAAGLVFGKPYDGKYAAEYQAAILQVLDEFDLDRLPVLFGLPFGHTEPMTVLPYGAVAELCCEDASLKILEAGTSSVE